MNLGAAQSRVEARRDAGVASGQATVFHAPACWLVYRQMAKKGQEGWKKGSSEALFTC